MSDDVIQGLCPSCDGVGHVGTICDEKVCGKRSYRFLPREYHAKVADQPAGATDPVLGQLIGDYLVVDVLGAGGFGTVYLALQQPIQLKAALKLMNLRADKVIADMMLEKFRAEAAALASLGHPNIVRLLKYGRFGDMPYLVMEFVEGGRTLKDEIAACAVAGRGLELNATMHVLHQSLNALEAAHQRAIVHRDIKPDNIMLQRVSGDPFFVRVLDFGLAKFTDERSLTSTAVGTPVYMAPEQLTRGRIGPWTDLYALGIVAYQMLTGMSPFPGSSQQAILTKKVDPSYSPTRRLSERSLPAYMVGFFEAAIHRDESARFQDAGQFRSALRELHGSMAAHPQAHVVRDISEIVDEVSLMKARRSGDLPSMSDPDAAPVAAFPSAPVDMGTGPGLAHDVTMASDRLGPAVAPGPPAQSVEGEEPSPKKSPWPFIGVGAAIAASLAVALVVATSGGDEAREVTDAPAVVGGTAAPSVETQADRSNRNTAPAVVPDAHPSGSEIPGLAAGQARAMKMKALLMVAREHARQRRWKDALTAYGEALARDADNDEARAGFRNASAEQSRAQAISAATKLLDAQDFSGASAALSPLGDVSGSAHAGEIAALRERLAAAQVEAPAASTGKSAPAVKRSGVKAARSTAPTAQPVVAQPLPAVTAPPLSGAPAAADRGRPKAAAKHRVDRRPKAKTSSPAGAKTAPPPRDTTASSGAETRPPPRGDTAASEPPGASKRRAGTMVKVDKLGKTERRARPKAKKVSSCEPPRVECEALRKACVPKPLCVRATLRKSRR